MAFGQQPGPPASSRQLQDLLALIQAAGHRDFKDARGPMGFNQRQAGGRFTRDEADELIRRLQEAEALPDTALPPAQQWQQSAQGQLLRRIETEQLAAELRRREWIVIEPLRS